MDIQPLPNRLHGLRRRAVIAGSGALVLALTACGTSETSSDPHNSEVTTTVTVPESGPIDTMSELFHEYCEGTLNQVEMDAVIRITRDTSEKATSDIIPGEKLQTPVGICDTVQTD